MFQRLSNALLLLSATLQAVTAQTACNNSPALCSRQYNNITYLGAHDSPFLRDSTTGFSTSGNQYYNTTRQLAAGIRLLTAQVQNPNGTTDLHVCHTSCSLLDAGPLSSWLGEIKTWMDSNPNDVVTILLVNGPDATATQLASAYTSSGMDKYAYRPATKAPSNTWPTLQSLISNGTRAMNFVASLNDNTAAPYLMNEFTYMFENSYDNSSPSDFSCEPSRPANVANQSTLAITDGYLSLVNHFLYASSLFGIQVPNEDNITTTNAASGGGAGNLGDHAATCATQYGKAPNFLLVDFFNTGPAIATVDTLNGVSNPTGRTPVPAERLTEESSAGTVTLPQTASLFLGLGTALLGFVLL